MVLHRGPGMKFLANRGVWTSKLLISQPLPAMQHHQDKTLPKNTSTVKLEEYCKHILWSDETKINACLIHIHVCRGVNICPDANFSMLYKHLLSSMPEILIKGILWGLKVSNLYTFSVCGYTEMWYHSVLPKPMARKLESQRFLENKSENFELGQVCLLNWIQQNTSVVF